MNFSDKHTLVLAVVGVLFLVSNISWIAHARLKGEKYLGKTIFEGADPEETAVHFAPQDEDWMYPNNGEDLYLNI